ncbi:MAG: Rhodanese-related sulfurtransferase [Bacteroidetes bacterium]|jgi:rhodanese-related sulfurtransferase|nr:Rhodanese-related sulfurtransferase [Bacteroidota bacterium]
MNLLFTSIMFLLSSLFGCQQPKNYTSLSTGEFESLIKDEHVQRLDVRTPAEYSEDHIAKSININVFDSSFASLADSLLKKEAPVAIYCHSGHRSKQAASILAEKGYTVYELKGGFAAWQKRQ